MEPKQLWVLAGGNGAGKTTFFQIFLAGSGLAFVNADLIARNLDAHRPEHISYPAAQLADRLRRELLQKGVSFCAETLFSHQSKVDFVAEAKALGYEVILVFIHLQFNELNQARIAQRVSEGGHDVPAEKVVSRIPRTLRYVREALPLTDRVRLYDNSSEAQPYRLIAELKQGTVSAAVDPLPDWACALLRDYL